MNSKTKMLLQKLRQFNYILLYKLFSLFNKLDGKKVLFLSSSRSSLTGNFEFVYNEISKLENYDINIMLKSSLKTKYTFKNKIKLAYLICTSKYIFLDDFYPVIYAINLRKGTKLIQLWHAMGAFKKVGYSRPNTTYSLTHRNYTDVIVSSESIRKDYAEAFGISVDKVHALGIPRTDIFFDNKYSSNVEKKLYNKYPRLKDKKIILFAPTFRGNGEKTAYYDFNWFDFEEFSKKLKDEYVCILKLHPFIKNKPEYKIENDPFYIDMSSEREINDLLFITDVLITDYSSVIFEYSFLKKPIIFFVPDFKEYKNGRDFYYNFDKYTYGPKASNMKEVIKLLKNPKVDINKLEKFNEYFCSACDGKSTKRVVKSILDR